MQSRQLSAKVTEHDEVYYVLHETPAKKVFFLVCVGTEKSYSLRQEISSAAIKKNLINSNPSTLYTKLFFLESQVLISSNLLRQAKCSLT